jgi:hypothetical protein
MFSIEISRVSKTEIFVIDCGTHQTIVYANNVTLKNGRHTAMILPVPHVAKLASTAATDIAVHDMSTLSDIFSRLNAMFRPLMFGSAGYGASSAGLSFGSAAPLPVHRCGSYRYTIVPALHDFSRLQHEVFGIDPASPLATILSKYYAVGFAFMVCIIDASAEYSPFAYSHPKHLSGQLFIPTRHYHGTGSEESVATDWDHTIYTLGAADSRAGTCADVTWTYNHTIGAGRSSIELPPGSMSLSTLAGLTPFPLPHVVSRDQLRRLQIAGKAPNQDLWFATSTQIRGMGTAGVCTFTVSGKTFPTQEVYACATCVSTRALQPPDGVCRACADRCHAGHAVTYMGQLPFFCDCGARGASSCGCLDAKKAVALSSGTGSGVAGSGVFTQPF